MSNDKISAIVFDRIQETCPRIPYSYSSYQIWYVQLWAIVYVLPSHGFGHMLVKSHLSSPTLSPLSAPRSKVTTLFCCGFRSITQAFASLQGVFIQKMIPSCLLPSSVR